MTVVSSMALGEVVKLLCAVQFAGGRWHRRSNFPSVPCVAVATEQLGVCFTAGRHTASCESELFVFHRLNSTFVTFTLSVCLCVCLSVAVSVCLCHDDQSHAWCSLNTIEQFQQLTGAKPHASYINSRPCLFASVIGQLMTQTVYIDLFPFIWQVMPNQNHLPLLCNAWRIRWLFICTVTVFKINFYSYYLTQYCSYLNVP